jgi:sterol desaturase/sphingolipid hydroxylase (fatty acid hydroxylase superfamily)
MPLIGTGLIRLMVPLAPVAAALIAEARGWGLLNLIEVPAWFAFLIGFVGLDLLIYAQHWAMHHVPLLWRLHRMHHSDGTLDATTGLRFHPFELVLSLGLKVFAVLALGAPAAAVLVFEVVLNATSMFTHANVRLPPRLEPWLRRLVVTPEMHRVHHSIVRAETDSNFGFNLACWDRLFGTYRPAPTAGDAFEIGIEDFRGEQRLDRLLVQPFK